MRHYCSYYSEFLFYVFHTPSNAVESKDKGQCFPKSKESAKESEVEEEVAYISDVLLLIGIFKGLYDTNITLSRNSLQ